MGDGARLPPGPAPRVATLPTTVDLAVLYSGRGQLLKVAEVAKKLGVCNATVYRLCESGALPHVRVVNSIRVRPKDLAEYLGGAGGRGVE
jgi:excisionase family DNA binding protein